MSVKILPFIFVLLSWCIFFTIFAQPLKYSFNVPSEQALAIGVKIWNNECDATISGLLSWNKGEDFASLGIGHFIWHSASGDGSQEDEFPRFIRYLRSQDVVIPQWLNRDVVPSCPWKSRDEFLQAKRSQNDSRFEELKQFLVRTIAWQIQYMLNRLQLILPKLIASVPPDESESIYHELYQLMQNSTGIYSLVDYLNFKGSGIVAAKNHFLGKVPSYGLLQVLEEMRQAPADLNPNQAFAWAARNVLIRRYLYSPLGSYEEKWLPGWLKRVATYN